jgi:hypothetical protein
MGYLFFGGSRRRFSKIVGLVGHRRCIVTSDSKPGAAMPTTETRETLGEQAVTTMHDDARLQESVRNW